MTTLIKRNATITIEVKTTESGYQVQSHLEAPGQSGTRYGKVYKSRKLAEKDLIKWVDEQNKYN